MKNSLSLVLLVFIINCNPLSQAHKDFELGNFRATIRVCKTILEKDSTDVDVLALMGRAYYELGHLDSAQIAFERAYSLVPGKKKSAEFLFKIHDRNGNAAAKKENYRVALSEYNAALEYYPNAAPVKEKIGDIYFAMGSHEKARAYFREALSTGGDSLRLSQKLDDMKSAEAKADELVTKGLSLMKRKRYDQAKQAFSDALELKPDHKEARYNFHLAYGHRLYKKGSVNALWDAIQQYGMASTLKPNAGEPLYYMGLAYNKKDKNEYDNAIWALEKCLEAEPNGPFAQEAKQRMAEIRKRKKLLEEFWGKKK